MLTHLELNGWQGHKHWAGTLDQVTTLIGRTGAGKSCILRALWWVLFNQGPGNMVNHGSDGASVSVALSCGHKVTRWRTKTENGYTLQRPDGTTETWKAIRSEVPGVIAALFNVTQANRQRQHDSPYWLAIGAGEVGRQLNAMVDLASIDTAITLAKQQTAQANAKSNQIEVDIDTCQAAILGQQWVTDARLGYIAAHANVSAYNKAQADLTRLQTAYDKAQAATQAARDADTLAKGLVADWSHVQGLRKAWDTVFDQYHLVYGLVVDVQKAQYATEKIVDLPTDWAKVQALADAHRVAVSLLGNLHAHLQASNQASNQAALLKAFIADAQTLVVVMDTAAAVKKWGQKLSDTMAALHKAEADAHRAQTEHKTYSEQVKLCPTCQRPL